MNRCFVIGLRNANGIKGLDLTDAHDLLIVDIDYFLKHVKEVEELVKKEA